MKNITYLFALFFSLSLVGQNKSSKKDFRVDLLTIEKKTKDTLAGSFIEVYSGHRRIKAICCTDFDGIGIFYLNPDDIVDNSIYVKIHGRKCKPYKKRFLIKNDLKKIIYLEYGKTEYNNPTQDFEMMFKKLNIQPDSLDCGTVD